MPEVIKENGKKYLFFGYRGRGSVEKLTDEQKEKIKKFRSVVGANKTAKKNSSASRAEKNT